MAFPVGYVPTMGDIHDLCFRTKPSKSVVCAAGAALDLTDPANGINPAATEFYCTTAGNFVAQLAGDSAMRTYPVTVGQVLSGIFVLTSATSTAAGILRQ
jgi:hypothetical protein